MNQKKTQFIRKKLWRDVTSEKGIIYFRTLLKRKIPSESNPKRLIYLGTAVVSKSIQQNAEEIFP